MVAMTKTEKERDEKVRELGCIACYVQTGKLGTPCCVHHITDTGRRKGHTFTIGLCNPGHHKDRVEGKEPFHHNEDVFESIYGSQEDLFALTNRLIGYSEEDIRRMAERPVRAGSKTKKSRKKLAAKPKIRITTPPPKKLKKVAFKPQKPTPEMVAKQKELQKSMKERYLEKNALAIEEMKEKGRVYAAQQRRLAADKAKTRKKELLAA